VQGVTAATAAHKLCEQQLDSAEKAFDAAAQRLESAKQDVVAVEKRLQQQEDWLKQRRAERPGDRVCSCEQEVAACNALVARREQELEELAARGRDSALLIASYLRAVAALKDATQRLEQLERDFIDGRQQAEAARQQLTQVQEAILAKATQKADELLGAVRKRLATVDLRGPEAPDPVSMAPASVDTGFFRYFELNGLEKVFLSLNGGRSGPLDIDRELLPGLLRPLGESLHRPFTDALVAKARTYGADNQLSFDQFCKFLAVEYFSAMPNEPETVRAIQEVCYRALSRDRSVLRDDDYLSEKEVFILWLLFNRMDTDRSRMLEPLEVVKFTALLARRLGCLTPAPPAEPICFWAFLDWLKDTFFVPAIKSSLARCVIARLESLSDYELLGPRPQAMPVRRTSPAHRVVKEQVRDY
jgi:hypothetical protein